MGRRREPLNEVHYVAIELLAEFPRRNHEEISGILGISRMTLYRWRQRKDFDTKLRSAIRAKYQRPARVTVSDMTADLAYLQTVVRAWYGGY